MWLGHLISIINIDNPRESKESFLPKYHNCSRMPQKKRD